MNDPKLFDLKLFEVEPKHPSTFCRSCVHRRPIQYGGTVIQYCGARRSNRTENKLLKIKAKNPACEIYEPKDKKL